MSTINITSATLKGSHSLDFSYELKDDKSTHKISDTCDAPVHEDLKQAFMNLIPHLALICEETTKNKAKEVIKNGFPEETENVDEEALRSKFKVFSFKVTGKDDSEGVSLSGAKFLKIGKDVKLSSPKLRWDEKDYPFIAELSQAIEELKIEVSEYLNGKHAPDNQIDMFEDFGGDGNPNGIDVAGHEEVQPEEKVA